jgi:hypothetical protein
MMLWSRREIENVNIGIMFVICYLILDEAILTKIKYKHSSECNYLDETVKYRGFIHAYLGNDIVAISEQIVSTHGYFL